MDVVCGFFLSGQIITLLHPSHFPVCIAAHAIPERSARALELMQTAVEWKSWEELRTLTKAFQCYLQESGANRNPCAEASRE